MAAQYTPQQLASIAYQQANPQDDKRYQIITACAVCLAVATMAVLFRLWARRRATAGLGMDDYMIVFALFFFVVISTSAIMTTTYGMGRHLIYTTNPEGLGITSILAEAIYNFVVGGSKISILCFYGRLFPQKWFRICRWALGLLIVAWCISQIFLDIFQCNPIPKFWTPTLPGHCIDFWAAALAGTIFNIITDFITLAMPIPLIWRLKVDRRRRLQLVGAFTIGGIACIASIVRGIYTTSLFAFDITWEYVGLIVSTEVELMMFIVSACIPTYASLWTRYRGQHTRSSRPSMPSSTFGSTTKHSNGRDVELSGGLSTKNSRWSALQSDNSLEEDNDKRIMITTAISSTSLNLNTQEDFKQNHAL